MNGDDRHRCDRLATAGSLVRGVVFGSLLIAAAVAAHGVFSNERPWAPARRTLDALNLARLSLVPSGRPARLPAAPSHRIDLRYDPTLALPAADAAGLLRKGSAP